MFKKDDEYIDDYNGDYVRQNEEYRAECEEEHGITYNNYNDEQRSYDTHASAESEFSSILLNGETILWSSVSNQKFGLENGCMAAPLLIFSLFWLTFSLLWTTVAFIIAGVFGLFGLPFVIIGLFMLFKIINPGKKFYAITNMRVIRKERNRFYYDNINDITDIRIEKTASDRGSITFCSPNSRYYVVNNNQKIIPTCLVEINNPEEAYHILNENIYKIYNNKEKEL